MSLLREVQCALATLVGSHILVKAAVQVLSHVFGARKGPVAAVDGAFVRALQIVDHVHVAGKVPFLSERLGLATMHLAWEVPRLVMDSLHMSLQILVRFEPIGMVLTVLPGTFVWLGRHMTFMGYLHMLLQSRWLREVLGTARVNTLVSHAKMD
jgi:hypothetical protein